MTVYIKHQSDNGQSHYLLDPKAPVATIMKWDSVDQAENYLYLNHKDQLDHYIIVTDH